MGKLTELFKRRRAQTPSAADYVTYVLDKTQDLAGRDSDVMDMWQFDDPKVEAALVSIATDVTEDEVIVDSAGHSLWQLWQRQGRVAPEEVVTRLLPAARKFFEQQRRE